MLKNHAIDLDGALTANWLKNSLGINKIVNLIVRYFIMIALFYHIEYTSEKYGKEDYETEVEILFNKGGLSEVFSDDKIAEYWYNIGSEHSDDDNILKLR